MPKHIGFVGDEFSYRGGGAARSNRCRTSDWFVQPPEDSRQSIPYNYAEDYYLVPAVHRDSPGWFFERHESRIENLAEQGASKVLLTVV